MTSLCTLTIALALLATWIPASGACRSFGTQLQCDLGAGRAVIGTQTAPEPRYARSFRPHSLQPGRALSSDATPRVRPFELQLQDVGADPSLCRPTGNETYCY